MHFHSGRRQDCGFEERFFKFVAAWTGTTDYAFATDGYDGVVDAAEGEDAGEREREERIPKEREKG